MKSNKNILLIITNNCQFSIIHCQFGTWSAFPAQTPYQYAYNSPLTYRDPTGLAPEKDAIKY
ncbi:MAG: hypothetical protein KF896_03405 [Ignavibacteriae bacterium]|nr:hypothetical protein [Ignavibacteriota bacterium]